MRYQFWLYLAVCIHFFDLKATSEQATSPKPAASSAANSSERAAATSINNTSTTTTAFVTAPPSIKITPCGPPVNFSALPLPTPDWYVRFYREYEEIRCRSLHFERFEDYWRAIAYDKRTRKQVPWTVQCDLTYDITRTTIMDNYYRAFYNMGPDVKSRSGDTAKMVQFICFFLSPLALITFAFGMYVIRRILLNDDSHLFVYHCILIFSDMWCYMLNTTHVTYVAQYLSTPLCYTTFYLASLAFDRFAELTLQPHESASFGLSNMIQALLAADRAVSLAFPMFYRVHANRKTSIRLVVSIALINGLVWIGQVLMTQPFRMILTQSAISSPPYQTLDPVVAAFGGLRAILFVVSWIIQFVGCFAVCILIFRAKVEQANAKKGKGKGKQRKEISMVPCYLLIGTCFMNAAGCTSQCIYLIMYFGAGMSGNRQAELFAKDVNNYQVIFIPILNNLGFYIHCVVCKQYRDVVKRIAINSYRRIKTMVTHTEYVPYVDGETSMVSMTSQTSVISMKSRDSKVSPTAEP